MTFRSLSFLASLVLVAAACTPGEDPAMLQAKQECRDRGLSAGTAEFGQCVFEVSERIYVGWGRGSPSHD
jgi:hypothetical protein